MIATLAPALPAPYPDDPRPVNVISRARVEVRHHRRDAAFTRFWAKTDCQLCAEDQPHRGATYRCPWHQPGWQEDLDAAWEDYHTSEGRPDHWQDRPATGPEAERVRSLIRSDGPTDWNAVFPPIGVGG